MDHGVIYADVLEHCQPVRPPGLWGRFAQQADLWELSPEAASGMLKAFLKKYSEKDLCSAGVAIWVDRYDQCGRPLGGKELTTNPILEGPFNKILPLRALPTSHPFDLVSEGGACSGQASPCAVLHDYALKESVAKWRFVCLTFSVADLTAFRAVGIPAGLVMGLEQLAPQAVLEFAKGLGLSSPKGPPRIDAKPSQKSSPLASTKDSAAKGKKTGISATPCASMDFPHSLSVAKPCLFLVGWSPHNLSLHRPGQLDEVCRRLVSIGEHLEMNLDDLFQWRPAPNAMQRIAFCVEHGRRKDVQWAIVDSLRRNATPLGHVEEGVAERCDLLEARASLRKSLSRPGVTAGERRQRLREHREAVDRAFVTPLLEKAEQEPDLKRRSKLAALAKANQILHQAAELFLARLEEQVAQRGLKAEGQDAEAKGLLKMFDVVGNLTK